jgi:phosphate transport system substrate-binding protein
VLIHKHPKDASQSAETLRFFRWALQEGKPDAQRLNYVSLPDDLIRQIEKYLVDNIK